MIEQLMPKAIEAVQLRGTRQERTEIFNWLKTYLQTVDPRIGILTTDGYWIDHITGQLWILSAGERMVILEGEWIVRDSSNRFHVYSEEAYRNLTELMDKAYTGTNVVFQPGPKHNLEDPLPV